MQINPKNECIYTCSRLNLCGQLLKTEGKLGE